MPFGAVAAGIAGVATVAGASIQSGAAKDAAKTQAAATSASIAAQEKQYAQTRADNQPFMNSGYAATSALDQILLGYDASKGASPASAPGATFDWNRYAQQNPDVVQGYESLSPADKAQFPTLASYEAYHWQKYGQEEGRSSPVDAAASVVGPDATPLQARSDGAILGGSTYGVQLPDRPASAPRPAYGAWTGYTPTPLTAAPTFERDKLDPLDLSIGSYRASPGYDYQQQQGSKQILSRYGQMGGLDSGAALKALQDRSQDIADQDYNEWADRATQRYQADRSFSEGKFEDDRKTGLSTWQYGNDFTRQNNQFGANLSYGAWKDGQDQAQRAYDTDSSRALDVYNLDRSYLTDQYRQRMNDYFKLAGAGQTANSLVTQTGNTTTGAIQNATFSGANATAQAGIASANAVSNGLNGFAGTIAGIVGNSSYGNGGYDPKYYDTGYRS